MAVVARYGVWDNATYPWTDQTSAGLMGSIVTEIDAWITAITSNASITANGMLPVKKREPSDSTDGGTTNGFAYEFPDTSIGTGKTGSTYPTLGFYGTETTVRVEVGDDYQDTTANSGFGDWLSSVGHLSDTSGPGDAGYSNQAIVAYETTDGEEFFAVGLKVGSSVSDEICFIVFKDTDGHWCFIMEDEAFAYDTILDYWVGEFGPYDTDPTRTTVSSTFYLPMSIYSAFPTGAATKSNYGTGGQAYWYPKSSKLFEGRSTSSYFGHYADHGSSEQVVVLAYTGQAVAIPVT